MANMRMSSATCIWASNLPPVTVFDTYAFVYLFVQLLVQLGRELQQRLFQLVEHDKRVV